jgi:hypothetical protein
LHRISIYWASFALIRIWSDHRRPTSLAARTHRPITPSRPLPAHKRTVCCLFFLSALPIEEAVEYIACCFTMVGLQNTFAYYPATIYALHSRTTTYGSDSATATKFAPRTEFRAAVKGQAIHIHAGESTRVEDGICGRRQLIALCVYNEASSIKAQTHPHHASVLGAASKRP